MAAASPSSGGAGTLLCRSLHLLPPFLGHSVELSTTEQVAEKAAEVSLCPSLITSITPAEAIVPYFTDLLSNDVRNKHFPQTLQETLRLLAAAGRKHIQSPYSLGK